MKEPTQFNVFHQFAGCFVPHGLLSLRNLSAGAKLCYALVAQQANARGSAQLNLPLLAVSLGESVRVAVRYLTELEEAGLVASSRGNVNREDVRLSFPRHPWLARGTGAARSAAAPDISAASSGEEQPRLFAVDSAPSEPAAGGQDSTAKRPDAPHKLKRRRRWYGRANSRHTLETCQRYVTYQIEVLGRRTIYDPEGLAESLYHTGSQDDEISDWLDEQANAA